MNILIVFLSLFSYSKQPPKSFLNLEVKASSMDTCRTVKQLVNSYKKTAKISWEKVKKDNWVANFKMKDPVTKQSVQFKASFSKWGTGKEYFAVMDRALWKKGRRYVDQNPQQLVFTFNQNAINAGVPESPRCIQAAKASEEERKKHDRWVAELDKKAEDARKKESEEKKRKQVAAAEAEKQRKIASINAMVGNYVFRSGKKDGYVKIAIENDQLNFEVMRKIGGDVCKASGVIADTDRMEFKEPNCTISFRSGGQRMTVNSSGCYQHCSSKMGYLGGNFNRK